MRRRIRLVAPSVVLGVALAMLSPAQRAAADILVLSSQAFTSVMEEVAPAFERASGQHLVIRYGVSNALVTEIDSGTAFDVTILTAPLIDQLIGKGKLAGGSRRDIAKSGIGIAMKLGAVKPDLRDAAAFKTSMSAAPLGIAFTQVGASGVYFQQLVERLGLTEALNGKLHPQPGGRAAEQIARGEADYAFQQISELMGVAGTEVAGPLPPDLQLYTQFSAALASGATNPTGARALIDYLGAKERAPLLSAKGLEPN